MPETTSVIDLDRLRQNVARDPDLLRELAEIFQRELPGVQFVMAAALRSHDGPRLAKAAHRLKGSLATLGARCFSTAEQIENKAPKGCTPDISELAVVLEAEVAEVVPSIETILRSGEL